VSSAVVPVLVQLCVCVYVYMCVCMFVLQCERVVSVSCGVVSCMLSDDVVV
jgi:hypothetical protein